MNKVGVLPGLINLAFIAYWFLPMGFSRLPLYFLDDGGTLIGVWGTSTLSYNGVPIFDWWFLTEAVPQLLLGVIFWFFPFISCFLCFGGVNKPPEYGRKLYLAAFFLEMVPLSLLLLDAFFLGSIVLTHVYTAGGFLSTLNVGFWIYIANLVLLVIAARTYKEE